MSVIHIIYNKNDQKSANNVVVGMNDIGDNYFWNTRIASYLFMYLFI